MNQDEKKRQAAVAALQYIPDNALLGVGAGVAISQDVLDSNVYVAQIALGASDTQTNKAMLEADRPAA